MRVLGIDCGGEYTGYGIVEQHDDGKLECITSGAIKLKTKEPLPIRLRIVFTELCRLATVHRAEVVAIEEVFYSVNAKSALKLGQVRGVAMLAAASCHLPVAEYAPLSIKSAVTGYGRAEKQQVQDMVTRLLHLDSAPHPADAADALAIAICHLHTAATLSRQSK
jgi:crossover junction endodeoxyribonuclease RuvC